MWKPSFNVVGLTFVSKPKHQEDDEVWALDSSVRKHYVRQKTLLQNSHPCFDPKYKLGFSGLRSPVTYIGDVSLPSQDLKKIRLRNVYCVPESVHNLISVSELTTNYPYSVRFLSSGFVVKDLPTKNEVADGCLFNNQYVWSRNEAKTKVGIMSMIVSSFRESAAGRQEAGPELLEEWPSIRTINLDREVEGRESWIVSSYCTQHITNDRKLLRDVRPLPHEIVVPDFAGRSSPATHVGVAHLVGKGGREIVLHQVLFVQESNENYISVAQLTLEYPWCGLEFRSDGFVFKNMEENRVVADGPKHRHLYMWLNRSKPIACPKPITN